MALTLLTALDLPWVPDGHQRDGEHVREPVDALLRELLLAHRLPWAVIGGEGPAGLQQAMRAVLPLFERQASQQRRSDHRHAQRQVHAHPAPDLRQCRRRRRASPAAATAAARRR